MNKDIRRIKVYVGETRPCYDSAALCEAALTQEEFWTLKNKILAYMKMCKERRQRDREIDVEKLKKINLRIKSDQQQTS